MSIYKHALTGALMVSTTLAARLEMWSCYSEHDVQHDANFETTLESGLIQGESAQNDNPTSYPCQTFAAEAMFGQIDLPAEDGSQTKFTSKLLWGNETKRVIPCTATVQHWPEDEEDFRYYWRPKFITPIIIDTKAGAEEDPRMHERTWDAVAEIVSLDCDSKDV